jgi:predicted nucleic acid-binding protein
MELAVAERAPKLLDVEVLNGLRALCLSRKIAVDVAAAALRDFEQLPIFPHEHGPLLGRAWELRDSITAYDALYVALAEGLDATLFTCDHRLARSHGHGARIEALGHGARAAVRASRSERPRPRSARTRPCPRATPSSARRARCTRRSPGRS